VITMPTPVQAQPKRWRDERPEISQRRGRLLRTPACIALLLAVAACSTTVTLQDELARKEDGQRGPKVVITKGELPDGQPWIFYAYRKGTKVVCIRHAWIQKDGLRESEGTCSPAEGPKIVQSSVTFPRINGDQELRYYVVLVKDSRAERVRWRYQSHTQELSVFRQAMFGRELGFAIARLTLPAPPETIELLDAQGVVVHSEAFRD
jgi:hypothetical protein